MVKVQVVNGDRVRREIEVAEGTTVRECVRLLEDGKDEFQIPTMALLNGEPLLRKDEGWEKAVLSETAIVVFVELPLGGGGGSSGGMIVRALAAIAAVVVQFIPGVGQVMGAVLAIAITLVGSLIAMAIDQRSQGQIEQESADAASPTYSINATGNRIRMFQPEPEGFGRIRIVPDYVAQPFAEFSSNDQYGYFLYGIGRGLYNVESMYFGDTVFWQNGTFVDSGFICEDGEEFSQGYDVTLPVGGDWSGPYPAVGRGEWARTLRVTFRIPFGYGLKRVSTHQVEDVINGDPMNGNMRTVRSVSWVFETVYVQIQYCEIDDNGNLIGSWSNTITKSFKQSDTKRSWDTNNGFLNIFSDTVDNGFSFTATVKASKYARWAVRIKNGSSYISHPQVRSYVPGRGVMLVDDPAVTVYQTVKFTDIASTAVSCAYQFVEPGGRVTLFPTNVLTSSEVTGLDLFATNDADYPPNGGWVGPYAANTPGTQTTKIKIDFVFASGLGRYNKNGGLDGYHVHLQVQARKIDDLDNPIGDWFELGAWSSYGRTTTPQRRTRSFNVGSGRYQVRMRRTNTTDKDDKYPSLDKAQWVGLRAILPGQLTFPQSVVAIKIKATNALSQQSSQNFSLVAQRKLPLWNPSTRAWSEPVPTSSWAAAVSAVCQEPWGGEMSDSQIDLDTLWAIDAALQAKSHPWEFNAYLDGAYNLWQLILEMCQAVCVAPRLTGTVLSFVQDEPGRPVSYELNARNILRGSFNVTYATWTDDSADDVILDYLDEDANYQQRDVQATLPESESVEPATLNWIGITNREQAYRVAVRYAAMNRWRRVTVTCQVEALGRLMQVGDAVSVNHPRFHNTASGVVAGWNASSLSLVLEGDFAGAEASEAYISLTRPDGTAWGPVKVASISGDVCMLDSADYSAYLLQGNDTPFQWLSDGMDSQPTCYALHATKQFQRRMLVQSVSADDQWHFTLTLVNDAPEVAQYDSLPVPAWNGRAQTNVVLPAPKNLRVQWTAATGVAAATWRAVQGAVNYEVQHSADGMTWFHDGITAGTSMSIINSEDQNWSGNANAPAIFVRVASISNSQKSQWAEWPGDISPKVNSFHHDISVNSGSYIVAGNALTNSVLGNGTLANHKFRWGNETAGYGAMTKNSNGTYSYTLDNSNPAVQALVEADTLTETFSYSYADADGDADYGFIEITIGLPVEA